MIEVPVWLFVGLIISIWGVLIVNSWNQRQIKKTYDAWKKSCDSSHEMDQEVLAKMERCIEVIEKGKAARPKCVICGFSRRTHMINAMDHEYLERPQ